MLQVGVKILLRDKKGRALLVHRSSVKYPNAKGRWDIPGGRIEKGSSLLENLKREVSEETNLKIKGTPKLLAAQDIIRGDDRHVVRLTFLGEVEGKVKLNKRENDSFKWVSLEEIFSLEDLDFYFSRILKDFKKEIVEFLTVYNRGQVNYSDIRFAPVINCILKFKDKILIVRRSKNMRFYPGYWNGISGFLDDRKSLVQKVRDELKEELGISKDKIKSIRFGQVFDQEEPKYNKTWIVHPVLVEVKTDKIKLDWEGAEFKWLTVSGIKKLKLLPGFEKALESVSALS